MRKPRISCSNVSRSCRPSAASASAFRRTSSRWWTRQRKRYGGRRRLTTCMPPRSWGRRVRRRASALSAAIQHLRGDRGPSRATFAGLDPGVEFLQGLPFDKAPDHPRPVTFRQQRCQIAGAQFALRPVGTQHPRWCRRHQLTFGHTLIQRQRQLEKRNGVQRCSPGTCANDMRIIRDAPAKFPAGWGIFHGLSATKRVSRVR